MYIHYLVTGMKNIFLYLHDSPDYLRILFNLEGKASAYVEPTCQMELVPALANFSNHNAPVSSIQHGNNMPKARSLSCVTSTTTTTSNHITDIHFKEVATTESTTSDTNTSELQLLLRHHLARKHFKLYLLKTQQAQQILFWEQAQLYAEDGIVFSRNERAKQIIDCFLQRESPLVLPNIHSSMILFVQQRLEIEGPVQSLFYALITHVEQEMQQALQQFAASKHDAHGYKEMCHVMTK